MVQAVDVEQFALDIRDTPSRGHHVGPGAGASPDPADRMAADLVVPADRLPLDVGRDPEELEVERQVELMSRGEPAALEGPVGVRDRVDRQVREDRLVVDFGRRVDVGVVDPGVLEIRQPVAQERVAQPVIVPLGIPLGLGVEGLEVGLGQQGGGDVPSA